MGDRSKSAAGCTCSVCKRLLEDAVQWPGDEQEAGRANAA